MKVIRFVSSSISPRLKKACRPCLPLHGVNTNRPTSAREFHGTKISCSVSGQDSSGWCVVHPEVKEAITTGRAVVALETAIVTHGMPSPHNMEVAQMVEDIVRQNQAVPATIGVISGRVHVGLSHEELSILADEYTPKIKISRRDFPFALGQRCTGGTTVSGTMLIAHKVGIPLFVTGGIGGVHRGGETSMDISADLTELGRTPVAVVCAGAKSILDIGRTLEVLETQGVCVVTYGISNEFPAFFTRNSGHKSPYSLGSFEECAQLVHQCLNFNTGSGVLISVPIPESAAAIGSEIETAIGKAVKEAEASNIKGKDVTPFILRRVNDVTAGKSLQANIALVKNNAEVGSRVAVRLAQLRRSRSKNVHDTSRITLPSTPPPSKTTTTTTTATTTTTETTNKTVHSSRKLASVGDKQDCHPVVVGGAVFDLTVKLKSARLRRDGTNPGCLHSSVGGVGRNIAEMMARLDMEPLFVTAVGEDTQGQTVTRHMDDINMSTRGVQRLQDVPTASYCILLDHRGEMFCGIGDMDCMDHISPNVVMLHADNIRSAPMVIVDANIPVDTIRTVCSLCHESKVPVLYEPTAAEKACRVVAAGVHDLVTYSTPNLAELVAMGRGITRKDEEVFEDLHDLTREEKLSKCLEHIPVVVQHIPNLFVKLGCDGVIVTLKDPSSIKGYSMWHYKAADSSLLPVNVVSVSGAGDSFVGALASCIIKHYPLDIAVKAGLKAAYLSLHSELAIPENARVDIFNQSSVRDWAPWQPMRLL